MMNRTYLLFFLCILSQVTEARYNGGPGSGFTSSYMDFTSFVRTNSPFVFRYIHSEGSGYATVSQNNLLPEIFDAFSQRSLGGSASGFDSENHSLTFESPLPEAAYRFAGSIGSGYSSTTAELIPNLPSSQLFHERYQGHIGSGYAKAVILDEDEAELDFSGRYKGGEGSGVASIRFTISTDPNRPLNVSDERPPIAYPNPVKDVLFLQLWEYNDIEVFTMDGKPVKVLFPETNQIDVSNLPAGSYLIRSGKKVIKFQKRD